MRKLIITIFMFFLAIVTENASGQRYCGSELNLTKLQQTDPARYQRIMNLKNATRIRLNGINSIPQTTIIIPVVVHVVYNNSAQSISDAQVAAQIQVLNADFRRQNADRVNTPTQFANVAADAKIEFRLAKFDPNWNSTTGITRTQTTRSSFSGDPNNSNYNDVKYSNKGGHDAWNPKRYLNIWVCNLSPSGLLGYSQFPDELETKLNTDGVVISYKYFGKDGHTESLYNKGRTTTHEVGHWLNLIHIWGDDKNCTATDLVDDTPNQYTYTDGCPSFPKR